MTKTMEITRLDDKGAITREWLLGHPEPAKAEQVKLDRVRLYPQVAHPGPAWQWLYVYTADAGPEREYGTGLTDARRFVRRNFPNAAVTEVWKA